MISTYKACLQLGRWVWVVNSDSAFFARSYFPNFSFTCCCCCSRLSKNKKQLQDNFTVFINNTMTAHNVRRTMFKVTIFCLFLTVFCEDLSAKEEEVGAVAVAVAVAMVEGSCEKESCSSAASTASTASVLSPPVPKCRVFDPKTFGPKNRTILYGEAKGRIGNQLLGNFIFILAILSLFFIYFCFFSNKNYNDKQIDVKNDHCILCRDSNSQPSWSSFYCPM